MNAGQMGADMVMNSQGGSMGNGKNGKNGNGTIRKVATWGTAIVSIIVISVFISNVIGGSYRKDFRIEQVEKNLGTLCIQIKEIELKVGKMELQELENRTEMAQRLKALENSIAKIDGSLETMKTDMAVIKEINKAVKKLANNGN